MTARASALAGTLSDLPLPDLLAFLATSGQRGTLRIDGSVPATIELAEGRVRLADTDGDPAIEHHLAALGLDAEAVAAARSTVDRGVPWPDALLGAGIGSAEVRDALFEHSANTLFEVLGAPGDEFRFTPDASPAPHAAAGDRLAMDVGALLAEADRRHRAWRAIAAEVPSTAIVLRLAPTLPPGTTSVTLGADDWAVLAGLDGRHMLSDTVRMLGRTSFDVCASAQRLLGAGVAERV